jgi:hypothetical protein
VDAGASKVQDINRTSILIVLRNDWRKSRDTNTTQLDHANGGKKKDKVCYCLKVHLLFRSVSTIYILHGHLAAGGYVLVTSTS